MKDYTFHGVPCDQVTFATWMEQRNRGECPFCHRRLMARYNNTNRHIKVCPNKPKVGSAGNFHDFCRATLKAARKEAKEANIVLPKHITALVTAKIGGGTYFIEADGVKGEFYSGDCTFDAKTKYVRNIIDGKLIKLILEQESAGLAADRATGQGRPSPSNDWKEA